MKEHVRQLLETLKEKLDATFGPLEWLESRPEMASGEAWLAAQYRVRKYLGHDGSTMEELLAAITPELSEFGFECSGLRADQSGWVTINATNQAGVRFEFRTKGYAEMSARWENPIE